MLDLINVDFSSASIFGSTESLQLNKVIGRVESSVEQQSSGLVMISKVMSVYT